VGKKAKVGVLCLTALLLFGTITTPKLGYAEESATNYENATVTSKGSNPGEAVIKGNNAVIARDEEKNSDVLVLNGGEENGGYLLLPQNLYEGVTEGFSVAMDIYVLDHAAAYQRIFQSTPVKFGNGHTNIWDSPDISVDLCDFSGFRTSVFVGTEDTAEMSTMFIWGWGALTGEWQRLVFTVSKEEVVMYYEGEQYLTSADSNVLQSLFEGDILNSYCYNSIGRSVYETDTDICAKFDNVAFYDYMLSEDQALAEQLPADATYLWDFEQDSVTYGIDMESAEGLSSYVDGTALTKMYEVTSPSGALATYIYADEATGRYFYSTALKGNAVLHASQLGMITGTADLSGGLKLVTDSVKRTEADEYNELVFTLEKNSADLTVIVRVYEDGMAYRYVIAENGMERGTIRLEASEVVFPDETVLWTGDANDTYEGNFHKRTMKAVEVSSFEMARPLLASVKNDKYWVLVTEASVFNVDEPYCASILRTDMEEKNIRWIFGRKQYSAPEVSYPFTSPWRVAIVTDNLNDLAGSELVAKLNPAPDENKDWSFVTPGKSVWSWWSSSHDAIEPQTQKDYIDFAAQNGWQHCLVDYGWELWDDYKTKVEDIVAYGKEKGIGVFLWYGVDKFDNEHIFDLNNRATIDEQFAWCESIGVAGIKMDYINSDSQEGMQILYDLADSAAEHNLMLIYHGCTNPNGEDTTYPNIVSYEAVRGEEYFKWNGQADLPTLLTYLYTRNVTGSMDFTPTAYRLSNSDATAGFQLAQTVVYESSVQHFAHSAYIYEGSRVLGFLNQVPTVWDSSLYGGYPGEYNWVARNSGEDWYIGAMTAEKRELEIALDFLDKDKTYTLYLYRDNVNGKELEIEQREVTATDILKLSLLANGGAAAIITEREIDTETIYEKEFTYYEAEDATLTGFCTVDTNNYASGLASVSGLGNNEKNSIRFDVNVPEDGMYDLKIFYISGENRYLSIRVNEEEKPVMKKLMSYVNDWAAPCRETIRVALKAGNNTISLFGIINKAPYVDRIAVAKVAAEKLPVAEITPTVAPDITEAPEKPEETPTVTEAPAENTSKVSDEPAKPIVPWIVTIVVILAVLVTAGFGIRRKKK